MGKQRSSLRQVPWQSWEHWNWVATELFSDSPERISGALNRIAAWQSRGKVPIAVETSAAIIGMHQRDPQVNHGIPKESALSEEMLRMMYAMAIQRLVNGVVDQSQKRSTTSVADRAEVAGLPRLLVDIRHEAAHTELPGLALLQVASKQALAWLKLQYWDKQRETLVNAKLELKAKLVEHCLLVVEILNPRSNAAADPQQCEGERESDSKSEELLEADPQETLRVKKQQRNGLFNDLLDLSISSMPNLISTLVDDGLLEQDVLPTEGEVHSKRPTLTGCTNGGDLTSLTDSAWKFTFRELSSHLPRLPEMLLVAMIKHLNKSCPRSSTVHLPEVGPTMSQPSDFDSDVPTDPASMDSLRRNRLISWCAWLLGKRSVLDSEDSSETEPRKSKLLKISNSLFVKTDLRKEFLGELLRLCLAAWSGKEPLVELVSLIATRLGNEKFQHRVAALAQLGTSMQRAHRDVMDTSENQEASEKTAGEERPQEDRSSEKANAAISPAGDGSSLGSELTMESALEVARSQQRTFLAKLSSYKKGASTRDTSHHKEPSADSPVRPPNTASYPATSSDSKYQNSRLPSSVELRQDGSEVRSWTVVENWRPCAIGMIPSPCHSVGIIPSLDLHRHLHQTEHVLRKPGGVFSEEAAAPTDTVVKPVDEDNLAAADRVEQAVRKRTTDEHLDESMRGKKLQKVGRDVRFENVSSLHVDEKGVANVSGVSPRGPTVSNHAASRQKEQVHTGSLLQGCLLQQGMFMPVTSQQLESLKSAVHVL